MDGSRLGQYDQRQFLARAAFLLNTPTPDDWEWLRRLACRPNPGQSIWDGGVLPDGRWADLLRRSVPVLAQVLRLAYPPQIVDPTVPLVQLLGHVHNWCLAVPPVEEPPQAATGSSSGEPALVSPPPPLATPNTVEGGELAVHGTGASPNLPQKRRKTAPGEARVKLIAALTRHHRYGSAGGLSTDPIGVSELARQAQTEKSTASVFLNKLFGGFVAYRATCRNPQLLTDSLKLLNGEATPKGVLFGRSPPGEGSDRED